MRRENNSPHLIKNKMMPSKTIKTLGHGSTLELSNIIEILHINIIIAPFRSFDPITSVAPSEPQKDRTRPTQRWSAEEANPIS